MADFLTPTERSDVMRRVKGSGTAPEVELVRALRRLGLRPQTNVADVPGKPDVVFRRARLACFVDGELWHGAQWRRRGLDRLEDQFAGAENRDYWVRKVHRTIERDLRRTAALLDDGWTVLRVWESDVLDDPGAVAERIAAIKRGDERPTRAPIGTAAEFFAGIGLVRRAIENAGWRTVWANDYDATKRRLYLHNLNARDELADHPVALDARPIQRVGARGLPAIGLATASFPCTDLSLAGAQRGIEKGPQSSAYLRFAKLIGEMRTRRPAFVLLENVVGLVTSNGGRDLRLCAEGLAEAGYRIDAMVVDARHFVPQSRPRMFLLGVRAELDLPPHRSPDELDADDPLRPERLAAFMRSNADLPWSIHPMPALPSLDNTIVDLLEDLGDDHPAWWSDERVAKLRGQVSERHAAMVAERIERDGQAWATAFRRMRHGRSMAELRLDGIAGCLRTPKGGSAKQILVHATADRWRVRLLTARECARLMGAGDFRLDAEGVSENDALFGFGDAVVVPAVEWVVRHAINPLAAELIRGEPMAAI